MDKQGDLIILYVIKRIFCFCDEWLFYSFLATLWKYDFSWPIITGAACFGFGAILTSYVNLSHIESQMGVERISIYTPFEYLFSSIRKQENAKHAETNSDSHCQRVSLCKQCHTDKHYDDG
jgi:hypothetical protein